MTGIYQHLSDLPSEKKELFVPIFGTIDRFYAVVYLIARNEHATEQNKPEQFEERLHIIRYVWVRIKQMLDCFGLQGENIMADIASDYFEDFATYKELEPDITNEEYISIIQRITRLN